MSSTSRPTFRIGMPTYRRPKDLAVFLRNIKPQLKTHPNVKIVVVNDGTHDDEYQRVVTDYQDHIDYRIQTENKGCGPTRAAAFIDADEDYVVCTDDDCVPPPFWLDWLEAMVEVYPDIDVFAGEIEPVWDTPGNLLDQLLALPESYPAPVVTDQGLLTAVGANTVVRRAFYQQVGGFPYDMRGAAEDCYLTQRILKAGGSYQIAQHWVIGHKAKNTVRELRGRFRGYGMGGAQYVLKEHDWVLADISTDATLKDAWRAISNKVRREWRSGINRSSLLSRLAFTIMTAVIAVEYERGWRQGLKKFAPKYPGGLPVKPPMVERFVDFEDESARTIALGGK